MLEDKNAVLAPIALFVYKRLWHTQQTVCSLQNNLLAKESELFIFSDGPKDSQSEIEIAHLRKWLQQISGFKKIHIIERDKNFGLAQSIIQGVTQLVEQFGKVIVIEDDLVLSPYFLQYMNAGLDCYAAHEQVASIHGYVFPIQENLPETYFIRGADCWGWATWQRAWKFFEADGEKLLQTLQQKKLCHQFDYNGTQPNTLMLKDQIAGKNNSWAIRWHASAFIHNMLTLYPAKSLVRNIGLDNSGEHCGINTDLDVVLNVDPITLKPIPIEVSAQAFAAFVRYFQSLQVPFYKRILRKIKNVKNMV